MATKKDMKAAPTSLYRKYRPQSFKDVAGQDHIVSVLEAAIKNSKIGHAYLFAGSRGIGKTSIARIFAREIGCTDKDLYELDAASNRGIEDIRALREGVHASPFESPYKVYIVDEAHMLTTAAWNAFLKTLEEPPAHAVFILATTELHKVPDTIQSRCEVYAFKQPSKQLLAETVANVVKKEGTKIAPAAAELIAMLAEGSFRDAHGITQKVLTVAGGKTIDVADVEAVTGAPPSTLVSNLFDALVSDDTDVALAAVSKAIEANVDVRTLVKLLAQRLRAVLLLRYAPDMHDHFKESFTAEVFEALEQAAKDKQNKISSHTLRELLSAYADMGYAALPHVPLELALIALTSDEKKIAE